MNATMVPPLPDAAIQRALDAGEWSQASDLLADHDRAVRAALATNAPDARSRDAWQALLAAQLAFLSQLQAARSQAAQSLRKFDTNRRSVRAYQGSVGA